ncbi:hypothetical protein [Clostridium sp. DSM 8431]|nr:hypothetical protein [Clostridium sp. DSM 8431]
MCTSITLTTNNNDVILGRTLDWMYSGKPLLNQKEYVILIKF